MADTHRRGFVTGGTWCVDRNCLVSHWPGEDGIAEYLAEDMQGGGSGCNLAVNMKRLDPAVPVETITIVGDDEAGRFLHKLADSHGINRRQMQVVPGQLTQIADAFVSKDSGRRTHIFRRGVASLLTPDHFDFGRTAARYLHLGLPGIHNLLDGPWRQDENGWVTILSAARARGLKTNMEVPSLDPQLLAGIVRPCLPHLDMIIVNDTEIGALAGLTTVQDGHTDRAACERAARMVLESGVGELVVVHWPQYALAVPKSGATVGKTSVAMPRKLVVSANGAGDAFAGGMLFGLHEGWPLEPCLTLAHANAACSLRSLSTTDAIEPWSTTLKLAEAWGWRS